MNCREVRDVVCAFDFYAHHGGRRMHHAEPHENPRDAEPAAAQWLSRVSQQSQAPRQLC